MPVNENDFDVLQCYLDGELPVSECEGLWRRLAAEPALSAELDRLRADVAVRQLVWTTLEPSDLQVAKVETETMRAMRRHKIFSIVNKLSAVVSVAAACILFGFTVGWLGHERYSVPGAVAGNPNPNVQQVSNTTSASNNQAHSPGRYVVQFHDSAGHVVAEQTFDNLDDARRFAQDVNNAQSVRQQSSGDPFIVPVSGHF